VISPRFEKPVLGLNLRLLTTHKNVGLD
jgi:hypothetical protein